MFRHVIAVGKSDSLKVTWVALSMVRLDKVVPKAAVKAKARMQASCARLLGVWSLFHPTIVLPGKPWKYIPFPFE